MSTSCKNRKKSSKGLTSKPYSFILRILFKPIEGILYLFYLVGQLTLHIASFFLKLGQRFYQKLIASCRQVIHFLSLIGQGVIYLVKTVKRLYFKFPRWYRYVTTSAFLAVFLSSSIFYFTFLWGLPGVSDLENHPLPQSSQIFDRQGNLLYVVYNGKINRLPILLNKIPKVVKDATIAVEDKNFYQHHGISVKGVVRAFVNNLAKKPIQGGSTITQQLVKICLLKDDRRIISRKIREAYLAILVDFTYPKDKILEMYLNNAPYGGIAYGIEAAARKYFGKKASELSLNEAALLASLPSAPTVRSPYLTRKDSYKKNQQKVLSAMVEEKMITKKQADEAYKKELSLYSIENQIAAPHFVFWVVSDLERRYGKRLIQEGGLIISTTLDLKIQQMAEKIVKEDVEKNEDLYWISNGASLITEPKTGRVLAMVGSRDYFDEKHDGNVNVCTSKRQPGSSIKVINYAYALSHGKFTPSSIIDDSPVTYRNAWEGYSPINYDGKYRGSVTVKQALAMSLNVPAVKVLNTYGADKMLDLGKKMGITSWENLKGYGLSLTLGAGEVKMTELATAYGVLPNLGIKRNLRGIEKVSDSYGNVIEDNRPDSKVNRSVLAKMGIREVKAADEEERVLPEYTAYQLTNILSDNDARTPIFGSQSMLYIPGHKVAVKTGTTNEIRDNWTIGYTPDYLVATWVGNNNNQKMNPYLASGVTGAAPIWNEIMTNLLKNKPAESFDTPLGMLRIKVCAANGLLPCDRCPKVIEDDFVPGTEPKTHCYFPTADECKAKKEQMTQENKSPDEITKALVNCPPETNN